MSRRTPGGRMSRRQQVLDILRSEIMTGRYEPGERLIEAAISEELGTSRGPVREALRQLEHEGLVVSVPYRGAVVLDVSDEEVQEVLIPIRLTLESYSFTKAMELMTDDDFGELAKQIWLMEEGARRGDLQQIVEADLRFHEIVIATSGRPHTMQVWRSIWPRIRNYFVRYGRFRPLETNVEEHRELLEALASRDPEQMLEVLERHIAVPVPTSAGSIAGEAR
jgi:DNA-binding GntR family transcriptional regulator